MAFGPDGTRLASGGDDGTARVWDARTGREALPLKGHQGEVHSVAFGPDGTRLASGGSDGTVRVWDAGNGQQALPLKVHQGLVTSVAFSPDGAHVVGEDMNGTRLAWEAVTGQPAPPGDLALPKGQTHARHPTRDLVASVDPGNPTVILVHPAGWPPTVEDPDGVLNPTGLPAWHDQQAADAEKQSQWYAAAFHLERLHRAKPTAAVRARLLSALRQTPDSPAGRAVRDRLVAFDAARLAAAVGGRNVLTMPPLTAAVPPLAAPPPAQPARMPRAN